MASGDAALLRKVLARLASVDPAPTLISACESLVGAALCACSVPRHRLRLALLGCCSDRLDYVRPCPALPGGPLELRHAGRGDDDGAPEWLLSVSHCDRMGRGTTATRRWRACSSPQLQCSCQQTRLKIYPTTQQVRVCPASRTNARSGGVRMLAHCMQAVVTGQLWQHQVLIIIASRRRMHPHACLWLVAGPFLERLLDVLYLPLLASSKPSLVALQAEVRRL